MNPAMYVETPSRQRHLAGLYKPITYCPRCIACYLTTDLLLDHRHESLHSTMAVVSILCRRLASMRRNSIMACCVQWMSGSLIVEVLGLQVCFQTTISCRPQSMLRISPRLLFAPPRLSLQPRETLIAQHVVGYIVYNGHRSLTVDVVKTTVGFNLERGIYWYLLPPRNQAVSHQGCFNRQTRVNCIPP